jgi:hypothetical protein
VKDAFFGLSLAARELLDIVRGATLFRQERAGRRPRRRTKRKAFWNSERLRTRSRHLAGYGPDYKFFTHRLGHGIGLDGHEHPYLVRGSKTNLMPGMIFSNEPGVYFPGEFGIRCEDLMVTTDDGPAQLLTPRFQISPEKPLG